MSTLMQANREWSTRPNDERFVNLYDLHSAVELARSRSKEKSLSSRGLTAVPIDGDNDGLQIVGPNGAPVGVSNWAFGQLAGLAGAPAGYLRNLPAALAADNINWGLHHARDVEDVKTLLTLDDVGPKLRAVTGPGYGRIWNATITKALCDRFGDGLSGDFRVPGEFGQQVEITKDNTTLFASDRDMFVFLADERHKIEIANRRDGKSGLLSRGFFIWNSEVGSRSFGIATFLFDYVCCNRIVWGAQGYEEITLRHSSGAPDRWIEQVAPAIERYANSSAAGVVKAVTDARQARVDDVDSFLKARKFSGAQVSAIKAAHMVDEQRPMETLWDISTGITAHARSIAFQDARVDLEREAGKILNLAAK